MACGYVAYELGKCEGIAGAGDAFLGHRCSFPIGIIWGSFYVPHPCAHQSDDDERTAVLKDSVCASSIIEFTALGVHLHDLTALRVGCERHGSMVDGVSEGSQVSEWQEHEH